MTMKKLKKAAGKLFWKNLSKKFVDLISSPAFYIYLFAVVIYLPWFLPNLSEISPWDETYYLMSGKRLFSGEMPSLAYGPLMSVLYAICYLPFRSSPFWLVHVNSLGRFLLFSLLFLGTWQVGKALKKYFHPLIIYGFLFLTPFIAQNFEYPSDLLFAAVSAIAFAQAIRFLETKNIKHVWWASFWLGMGMLTRGDALILIVVFLSFVLIAGFKHCRWWRLILAALVPFLALTAGFVLLRGAVTGDFNTEMAERSYTAFEQGQEVDMPSGDDQRFDAPIESYYIARELFGTPEENDYSVFKAIANNPQAYLDRLKAVVKGLPGLYLTAYYRRYAVLVTLLAVRGLIELLRRKRLDLAVLHLIWFVPITAGIARTLVRVGYFRLFCFALFSLAIIGLKALLVGLKKGWEGVAWAGIFIALLVYAFRTDELGIQLAMTVSLGWLLLAFLLARKSTKLPQWMSMALLLLLAAGFMLRGDFQVYVPRTLGEDFREEASLVLRDVTEPGDYVLTVTPSVVFMAEREVANFSGADIPEFESSTAFVDWMAAQDFAAIYLDGEAPSELWELSLDQAGKALTQVYVSDGGKAYIFLLD
jgi:hypothetical protein